MRKKSGLKDANQAACVDLIKEGAV